MNILKNSFNIEDASQIFVGAFALALPISFSEEAWQIGAVLPLHKLSLLMLMSLIFIALYIYSNVFQNKIKGREIEFGVRIVITYVITAVVVLLILYSLDKLPILTEPSIAIKRVIVITMPASMGAMVVDSLDKE